MLTDLQDILDVLDRAATPAAYAKAARAIQRRESYQRVRIALLSSFTVDPLRPYLEVEVARQGLAADVYVAPFNTVAQELLDASSGCAKRAAEVVFVAQRLVDVCQPLAVDFLSLSTENIQTLAGRIVTDAVGMVEGFRRHSSAAVVVHNFALPRYAGLGIHEAMAASSQTGMIRALNTSLTAALTTIPGVWVLDYDRVAATVGYRHADNEKLDYLGRAPLSAPTLPELARVQAAFVQAILGRHAKCLVLDLDETLWGGVLGEAGPSGILIGDEYPGSVYRDFQRALRQLNRRGILLAINSKNNASDVEEAFRARPEMVLQLDHFAARRVNWQDKPANMREIADELNIGLDSLVFFDDNPAERARMRAVLPHVRTLEVPADPLGYVQTLDQSRAFDSLNFTDEDRRRGQMYRAQADRISLERSATSLEEFLQSLEMSVSVRAADESTLPRVTDLVQKTNQFNMTTRRHPAAALARMAADSRFGVLYLRLRDRFGDQGIVGVAVLEQQGSTAVIDTFLMSCRVIGRNVETAMLSAITEWAALRHLTALEGDVVRTTKNTPARDVYQRHGFSEVFSAGGSARWRLPLDRAGVAPPPHIAFEQPEFTR
jgi:FkbH-like protein